MAWVHNARGGGHYWGWQRMLGAMQGHVRVQFPACKVGVAKGGLQIKGCGWGHDGLNYRSHQTLGGTMKMSKVC